MNYDLWARLLDLIAAQESVRFNWIRGHVGHPENERCDELANIALNGESLLVDSFYEQTMNTETGEENTTTTLFGTETTAITAANPNLKITTAGDPCRKCGTAVIQRPTKKKELKPGQTYYFEYFFLCPKCKTAYMVEEAKRFL